ncbi:MAG: prepilin peptidase [Pseudomonadota bacterium]
MIAVYYGLLIGLAIALLVAAFTDIRSRRIANWLNAAIALGAPVFWWASGMALWPDMAWQFGFALLVTAILIGLYAVGLLGGGDIKLLAALALWIDPDSYLTLLVIMAVVGGFMAVGFVVRRVVLKPKQPGQLPYGVAIAAGALWVMTQNYFPSELLASTAG